MNLRIGWASPWNTRSAIALFGTVVTTELASRGHTVEILRTEWGEDRKSAPHAAPGPIHHLQDVPLRWLRDQFDVIIVNVGNFAGFHGSLPLSLHELGCIVILHDSCMAGLLAHLVEAAFPGPAYQRALRTLTRTMYGQDSMPDDEPFHLPWPEMQEKRPMLEWFAGPVIGAVVHADHYAMRVRHVCPGPVVTIPLAYPDLAFPPLRAMDRELVILTIGHINPNKCPDHVISAIASSRELRSRCRYRLVGPYEEAERQRLLAVARDAGIAPLEFTGWVSDADLLSEFGKADVVCCLRNPILEGGSASVIVGMLSGRPVLVSDHGVYAEIPAGLVLKCEPGRETVCVAHHLSTVVCDPVAAQQMGSRARRYAIDRHSAVAYVDALLPFLSSALPGSPGIMASISLGRTLASLGLTPDDPAVDRAVEPLASLLAAAC